MNETDKRVEKMVHYANGPSLEEINNTVEVPKNASFGRTLLAYIAAQGH